MLNAAIKALGQMFSAPFRKVLWKSIGLALVLVAVLGIALYRFLLWFAGAGQDWAADFLGATAVSILAKILSIAASLGIVAGSVFLMPAVTALVASLFVDEIAEQVERDGYPGEPVGVALPVWRALWEGVKTALLAILVYLIATPFLLLAGFGAVIFFLANAFLLGREYFELAAMRYLPPGEAKRLRKVHRNTVFIAGMFIAAFVSIPILNLATPLFGTAFMAHMHKRLGGTTTRLTQAPR